MTPQPNIPGKRLLMAAIAIAMVYSASGIGGAVTYPNIAGWYAGLNKPFFTPPNWVFGPVWSALYVMMALAFWRILIKPTSTPGKGRAIAAFVVQMGLNALWSVAFFGLNAPLLGLIVIAALLLAIVVTLLWFRPVDGLAALLLVPYLMWVGFASALNAGVYWLNR